MKAILSIAAKAEAEMANLHPREFRRSFRIMEYLLRHPLISQSAGFDEAPDLMRRRIFERQFQAVTQSIIDMTKDEERSSS